MQILIMEDDVMLCKSLRLYLEKNANNVTVCFCAKDAIEVAVSKKFDLFLFDIDLPDINGIEAAKEIRGCFVDTPIIFVSSYTDIKHLTEAFNVGCEDYMKKPIDFDELILRINKIKKINQKENGIVLQKNIVFFPDKMEIVKNGISNKLQKKQSDLLMFLIEAGKQAISSESIISHVWQFEDGGNNEALRTQIKKLRKILDEDIIETVRGVGYRLKENRI